MKVITYNICWVITDIKDETKMLSSHVFETATLANTYAKLYEFKDYGISERMLVSKLSTTLPPPIATQCY